MGLKVSALAVVATLDCTINMMAFPPVAVVILAIVPDPVSSASMP